jgi:hypothetical protein
MVGERKKAWQWMKCSETNAEKIGKTVKTKKHTKQTKSKETKENIKQKYNASPEISVTKLQRYQCHT